MAPGTGSSPWLLPTVLAVVLLGGLVSDATDVGVQVVASLDGLDLDRSTFVGVLAMILLGVSGVRVVAAWTLGRYDGGGLLALSAVAALAGLAGVDADRWLRRPPTSDPSQSDSCHESENRFNIDRSSTFSRSTRE